MRLKSFNAPSMMEAMQMVRDALGDDAIIVTSKEGKDGHTRITAAVEHMPEIFPEQSDNGKSLPDMAEDEDALLKFFEEREPKEDVPERTLEQSLKNIAEKTEALPWQPRSLSSNEEEIEDYLTDVMLKHGVPAEVSEKIISMGLSVEADTPKQALMNAIEECFSFEPLATKKSKKPLVLVGPPGAGKTLAVAKLAARAKMSGLTAGVISTDTLRAGGMEQLEAFLNILDIPLYKATDAKSLKAALKEVKSADQIFIDTGGVNPFDPYELKDLAKFLNTAKMDPVLVLPAGGDAEECAEIAMTFHVLGIKKLLPTRLDFARRIGGILSAADRVGLSFCDGSHTHQVAEGLTPMDAKKISRMLTSGSLLKV